MQNGYIKTACASVEIKVADCEFNTQKIIEIIEKADKDGINILTLPELCVTGYTCGDLFFTSVLIKSALGAVEKIVTATKGKYPVVVFGAPLVYNAKLYNCAICVCDGEVLGVVPKSCLADWGEHNELRYFNEYSDGTALISLCGQEVLFGNNLVFTHSLLCDYTFAIELCEDLFSAVPVSQGLALGGADIILNLSASSEAVNKDVFRNSEVVSASSKFICGYVYANADYSESTQDVVFSAHNIIAQCGTVLAENQPFGENKYISALVDVDKIASERRKNNVFKLCDGNVTYVEFEQSVKKNDINFNVSKTPFVPKNDDERSKRAEHILNIQSYGLKKRIEHTNTKTCVLGISGGLDSTLALLVTVRAMDLAKRPRTDITCVTMPCFGTTKRTKSNAEKLCECLGVTFMEVDITKAVTQHFEDIGHNPKLYDVTFENAQARERTQVLMDIANKYSGLVIGTGDLSELALGWATYNGDHMSMYSVNCSVPKTLVRVLVEYERKHSNEFLSKVLDDILATPVSPELLPTDENGDIAQKTEEIVGPYELHDFFLYYTVRYGFAPNKIFDLCSVAFDGVYSKDTILKWLEIFTKRFFTQQFKRSCVPDGPKVGSVSLSPRGDFKMPTDAVYNMWLAQIEKLKNAE